GSRTGQRDRLRPRSRDLEAFELAAQSRTRAVQRHVHGSRLHLEQGADLAGAQVRSVLERDELSVRVVESGDGFADGQPEKGVPLELVRAGDLLDLGGGERPPAQELVEPAAGDT